jgi:6-phosphogluconolactonase
MTTPRLIAYVACMFSREIMVYELNAQTGDITQIQSMLVNGAALPMALSPDRRYLYAALRSEPYTVASLAIDASTGKLTHLADAPLPESMPYIFVDRSGRYLLGVTSPWHGPRTGRKSVISVSPIAADGVAQASHQVLQTNNKAHCVMATPSNRHVYATSCEEDMIVCRTFDAATGMLSTEAETFGVDAGAGPRHMVFHPGNRFLYLLNETDATIYTFANDERSGRLEKLQISRASPAVPSARSLSASDIHITPNGQFLYAAVRYSNTLAAFKVDVDSGMLTPIATYPTDTEPRGFNIDPLGRYVLVVGRMSDGMTVYAIDAASGALRVVVKRPVGLEPPPQGYTDLAPMRPEERGLRGPNWVEFITVG